MDICLWWTIYQLKDEIAKKFGPPVAQQSLFLQVTLCTTLSYF